MTIDPLNKSADSLGTWLPIFNSHILGDEYNSDTDSECRDVFRVRRIEKRPRSKPVLFGDAFIGFPDQYNNEDHFNFHPIKQK